MHVQAHDAAAVAALASTYRGHAHLPCAAGIEKGSGMVYPPYQVSIRRGVEDWLAVCAACLQTILPAVLIVLPFLGGLVR
jgi:hypothetical protein